METFKSVERLDVRGSWISFSCGPQSEGHCSLPGRTEGHTTAMGRGPGTSAIGPDVFGWTRRGGLGCGQLTSNLSLAAAPALPGGKKSNSCDDTICVLSKKNLGCCLRAKSKVKTGQYSPSWVWCWRWQPSSNPWLGKILVVVFTPILAKPEMQTGGIVMQSDGTCAPCPLVAECVGTVPKCPPRIPECAKSRGEALCQCKWWGENWLQFPKEIKPQSKIGQAFTCQRFTIPNFVQFEFWEKRFGTIEVIETLEESFTTNESFNEAAPWIKYPCIVVITRDHKKWYFCGKKTRYAWGGRINVKRKEKRQRKKLSGARQDWNKKKAPNDCASWSRILADRKFCDKMVLTFRVKQFRSAEIGKLTFFELFLQGGLVTTAGRDWINFWHGTAQICIFIEKIFEQFFLGSVGGNPHITIVF